MHKPQTFVHVRENDQRKNCAGMDKGCRHRGDEIPSPTFRAVRQGTGRPIQLPEHILFRQVFQNADGNVSENLSNEW